MTKASKPLILHEFNNDNGRGWVVVDPVTGNEIAHLTTSFRRFMTAWMDAPLGVFEVVPLEDEHA